jgi:signal peptidase I
LNRVTAATSKKRSGWAFPWRGLLLLAVVLGLVRVFLCAVLRVQTGSMEPTLHGDPVHGDELLVFTPWFKAWAPERYDLVMFERPNNEDTKDLAAEKLNVKRVVALPGEAIRIDDGDLYVTSAGGTVERRVAKTYSEFRPMLIRRFFERFGADFENHFTYDPQEVRPEHDGVTLIGGENKTLGAEIELAPQAVALDDGWMDASGVDHPGELPEQDMLFDLEVTLKAPAACMNFSFNVGANEFSIDIVPRGAGHDITATRTSDTNPTEYKAQVRAITTGSKHHLEFFHIDGQIGVAVDGRKEMCEAMQPAGGSVGPGRGMSRPKFSVWGSEARVTRFEVWRDIHYTSDASGAAYAGRSTSYAVPQDSIFVLGDNSRDSIDSRFYGAVPESSLRGLPIFIVGPKPRMGLVH